VVSKKLLKVFKKRKRGRSAPKLTAVGGLSFLGKGPEKKEHEEKLGE